MGRASGVASTPYQGYSGQEVAPVNGQQTAGIGTINEATGNIAAAGAPLSASDIQRYENPYTNDVINATQADFDVQNQRANSTVTGNAAAQGALGGDRVGVAQALTQEAQNRTQAPVIAGLRQAGYNQATQTAENQQRFGLTADQALMGAGQSQIGAGTLQQQTQQQQDTQSRQDYYQQQGYPFQVAQWLASIDTGVGSQLGGTSTSNNNGQTTGPSPNPWSQVAGLGLAGASLFLDRGGRVPGVGRRGYAGGGAPTPYGNDQTWVPQVGGITAGRGAPAAPQTHAPNAPSQQAGLSSDQMKGIGVAGNKLGNWFSSGDKDVSASDLGSASSPLAGLDASDYAGYGSGGNWVLPSMAARGGRIKRYANGGFADGGEPTFDDRFAETFPRRVSAGIGASSPSFSERYGGEDDYFNVPTPQQERAFQVAGARSLGAVNADDPVVLNSSAGDRWRSGVSRDNGPDIALAAKDQGAPVAEDIASNDNAPAEDTGPVAGVGSPVNAISRAIKAPAAAEDEPSQALAYSGQDQAGRPTAPPAGVGPASDDSFLGRLGVHVTPELKQGLLQAGLAMMASRRGGPGSFLGAVGEGGMAGLGAYSKAQEADREHALEELKLKNALEDRSLKNDSAPLIRDASGKMVVNPAYVKLKQEEQRDFKPQVVKRLNPATGVEDFYNYNPNTQQMKPIEIPDSNSSGGEKYVSQAAPKEERRKAPAASPEARDEGYIKWMDEHRPPGYADIVRGVADYEIDPNREASLQKGQRDQLYRDVKQYDPTYDQTHFGEKVGVIASFSRGQDRAAVNSLNVSVAHLASLSQLGDALQNGNVPLFNKIGNTIAAQLGRPAPTNFDAAKEIVGDEVVKAVVGGVNSQADREAIKKLVTSAQTPAQLKGVIQTFTTLLGGQLEGRRQGYQAGTGLNNFDQKYLSPATAEALKASASNPRPIGQEVQRAVFPSGIGKTTPETAAGAQPSGAGSDLREGRTGTLNGRPVIVKGGVTVYRDTGQPVQ